MTADPVETIDLSAAAWAALVGLYLRWRVADRDGVLYLTGPHAEAPLPPDVLDELEGLRLVVVTGAGDGGRVVLTPRGSTAAVLCVRQERGAGRVVRRR